MRAKTTIMKPVVRHLPGEPITDAPPERLLDVVDLVADPLVLHTGVTTTRDGRWALYVTVPRHTDVPLPEVERLAHGFPIVYQAAPASMAIARPAYPELGE